jgi:ankyrin repeat protein
LISYTTQALSLTIESLLQDGYTPLHLALINRHLEVVQFLVEQCGADVRATNSGQRTALDFCNNDEESEIAVFLRRFMEPKPKMFALCMGLHCRLGLDSPLNMLNVDVMQEIAHHTTHPEFQHS